MADYYCLSGYCGIGTGRDEACAQIFVICHLVLALYRRVRTQGARSALSPGIVPAV